MEQEEYDDGAGGACRRSRGGVREYGASEGWSQMCMSRCSRIKTHVCVCH